MNEKCATFMVFSERGASWNRIDNLPNGGREIIDAQWQPPEPMFIIGACLQFCGSTPLRLQRSDCKVGSVWLNPMHVHFDKGGLSGSCELGQFGSGLSHYKSTIKGGRDTIEDASKYVGDQSHRALPKQVQPTCC
jgi:hypothetical protein